MEFLRPGRKPHFASTATPEDALVTTLHTVLREPNLTADVMEEIAELSDRLIVMSQLSSQFLQEIFKVPGSKIDMVLMAFRTSHSWIQIFFKDRFGVEGKAVLLTFGCSRRIRASKT